MSTLITGGRIITAADDYVGDIFVDNEHIALIGESLDVEADRVIDAEGQVRSARRRRRPYAHGHLLRRHDYGRQPLRGHGLGRLRRDDDDRRLRRPVAWGDVHGRARSLAQEARDEQAGDRRRLPPDRHRPEERWLARRPGQAARRGRDELQALHGLQGHSVPRRRRDAVQDDAGRLSERLPRDGARGERRCDRRPRQRGARRGATRRRSTTH